MENTVFAPYVLLFWTISAFYLFLFSRSLMISVYPNFRANESGVKPSESFTFFFAPCFNSSCTMALFRFSTAMMSG